jgi:hypothetical protein
MANPNPEIARIGPITEKTVLVRGPGNAFLPLIQTIRTEDAESAVASAKFAGVAHRHRRRAKGAISGGPRSELLMSWNLQ